MRKRSIEMQNYLNIVFMCIKVVKTLNCVMLNEMQQAFLGVLCRTVDYYHTSKYNLTIYV